MDIRNWGLGQIMQLPDYCFGRRFMVSCGLEVGVAERQWDISEVALPDMCVIWEGHIVATGTFNEFIRIRIALGDQLPTAPAQMAALEPLFMGLGLQGIEPRQMRMDIQRSMHLTRLKMPVAAQGRRLVLEGETESEVKGGVQVEIVVSGVPKEIPDWLLSV